MKLQKNWKFFQSRLEFRSLLDTTTEAWAGHTRFAYDLIAALQPKVIVELGTYKGTSFFAFAQAIKDFKLKSQLIGIDTWQGDIHTGFYGAELLKDVKKIKAAYYRAVPMELQQMTFDDALVNFKNQSIDILHIDGLHTYEAVKHDFETWQDKVSKTGIVLFHDIHYKKRGFGVYKYWNKLKKKYSTLEFMHSNGLGILVFDSKLYNLLKPLETFWQAYYPVIAMNDALSGNVGVADFDKLSLSKRDLLIADVIKNKIKVAQKGYKTEIRQLKSERNSLQEQLKSVTNSKFFRLWQSYCAVRDSILKRS